MVREGLIHGSYTEQYTTQQKRTEQKLSCARGFMCAHVDSPVNTLAFDLCLCLLLSSSNSPLHAAYFSSWPFFVLVLPFFVLPMGLPAAAEAEAAVTSSFSSRGSRFRLLSPSFCSVQGTSVGEASGGCSNTVSPSGNDVVRMAADIG